MSTGAIISSAFERPGDTCVPGGSACRDPDALELFVETYQSRVARLAHRLMGWNGDTSDIVQEVFLAAFKNRERFRHEASPWTWLTVITINCCRTHGRKQAAWSRLRRLLPFKIDVPPSDEPLLRDEVSRQVRLAVSRLSPRDREVIVLFHLEHNTVAQISDSVGCSPNAVEVRLHRARAKLRTCLQTFMKE
jgi:RNA polymerase sigma factor (sigma-70 family)